MALSLFTPRKGIKAQNTHVNTSLAIARTKAGIMMSKTSVKSRESLPFE